MPHLSGRTNIVPFGYLFSTIVLATATALALWPRPTRGPRATTAFVIGSNANELPFVLVYWLVGSTVLAATGGDLTSVVGSVALLIALLTLIGLVIVLRFAANARGVLADALQKGIHTSNSGRPYLPLGRVLVAPLPIRSRAVESTRNVVYGPAGAENTLDVYRNRSQGGDAPALIYFHPGGFFNGRKNRSARLLIDRLVSKGWVCVSANYRLGTAGAFPNFLIDAKRAISWIRAHASDYGVDPHTVFTAGGSAGAHIAAMCALTANDPLFQPGFENIDTSVAAAIGFYGWYGAAPSSGVASAPADYLRADAPPFFVIHGNNDPMIGADNAREFASALSHTSTSPVVCAELPGAQHNFDRFASIRFAAVVDAVESFTTWVRAQR
jgi:acetyl esterase/lipase